MKKIKYIKWIDESINLRFNQHMVAKNHTKFTRFFDYLKCIYIFIYNNIMRNHFVLNLYFLEFLLIPQ